MICPECGGKTEVTHTRAFKEYVRRRRACSDCSFAFTTYEVIKPSEQRYPMGRPKKTQPKNEKHKKAETKTICKFNYGVTCDGTKKCSSCGWKPKKRS